MPRVLIVEDEPPIAELIAVNLRHNGFEPVWVEDGAAAQRELDARLPDVVLLDWMLPGESGLQLARRWRADARTRIRLGHAAVLDEAADARGGIGMRDDHEVPRVVGARLDEQRHVVDDQRCGIGGEGRIEAPLGLRAHSRVHDRVQPLQRLVVAEDQCTESRAIE